MRFRSRPAAPDPAGPALSLDDVSYRYPRAAAPAVSGVTLSVARGECVALVGANGSGKSTLTRLLNGLLRPTSGAVHVEGRSTGRTSVAELTRSVGFVFQNPDRQICCATVLEEVGLGLWARRVPPDEIAERSHAALARVGLAELHARHPRALSGGQRQQLAIASVLAMDPSIVVLDEPTTGQDPRSRRRVLDAVMATTSGATHVIVTHDMGLVAEMAGRVVVLCEGSVIADGPPDEVLADAELLGRSSLQVPPAMRMRAELAALGVAWPTGPGDGTDGTDGTGLVSPATSSPGALR